MELRSYGVMELWSYGVKELSQMLGCRVDGNPCQLVNRSTHQLVYSLTGKLTKHTTPLSPWRGAGGEALLSSLIGEGL